MKTKAKIEKIYLDFLAYIANASYDSDELFDLSTDLVEAIRKNEFPHIVWDGEIGEQLMLAGESVVSEISDRIKRGQSLERTEKMARLTLRLGRKFFKRLRAEKMLKVNLINSDVQIHEIFETVEEIIGVVEHRIPYKKDVILEIVDVVTQKPILNLKKKWYDIGSYGWEFVSSKPVNYPVPELPGLE